MATVEVIVRDCPEGFEIDREHLQKVAEKAVEREIARTYEAAAFEQLKKARKQLGEDASSKEIENRAVELMKEMEDRI